jgi:hypothetical protein
VNKVKEFIHIVAGFGLVTRFIRFLDIARDSLYSSLFYTHTHTSVRSHVFTAVA